MMASRSPQTDKYGSLQSGTHEYELDTADIEDSALGTSPNNLLCRAAETTATVDTTVDFHDHGIIRGRVI
jgi:hypothetical protein